MQSVSTPAFKLLEHCRHETLHMLRGVSPAGELPQGLTQACCACDGHMCFASWHQQFTGCRRSGCLHLLEVLVSDCNLGHRSCKQPCLCLMLRHWQARGWQLPHAVHQGLRGRPFLTADTACMNRIEWVQESQEQLGMLNK